MDDDDDAQPLPQYRHPWFIEQDRTPLPTLYDEEGFPVIQFAPVPMQRRRRTGWDEARQRTFIALLARLPSVTRAARAVGMSARSAYKLLDKPGADQFARAWDQALEHGMDNLRGQSLARCMAGGDFVPVIRRGRLVRVDFRRNDRLALALLSGKDRDVDHYRRGAQTRWRQKREWAAVEESRAQAEAAAEQARADYQREIDEMMERAAAKRRSSPRVRGL